MATSDARDQYTIGRLNGRYWNGLSGELKIQFATGYMEGVEWAALTSFGGKLPEDTESWPAWTAGVIPRKSTAEQLCRWLTTVYLDSYNEPIPIVAMIYIAINESRGEPPSRIEEMIRNVRVFCLNPKYREDDLRTIFAYTD